MGENFILILFFNFHNRDCYLDGESFLVPISEDFREYGQEIKIPWDRESKTYRMPGIAH